MVSALESWIQPTIATITSCSYCVEHDKGRFCNQNKKHGLCIKTAKGKVYGNIGSMELSADYSTAAWCTDEIIIFGGPQ